MVLVPYWDLTSDCQIAVQSVGPQRSPSGLGPPVTAPTRNFRNDRRNSAGPNDPLYETQVAGLTGCPRACRGPRARRPSVWQYETAPPRAVIRCYPD